jgi:hypothetical protein
MATLFAPVTANESRDLIAKLRKRASGTTALVHTRTRKTKSRAESNVYTLTVYGEPAVAVYSNEGKVRWNPDLIDAL